MTVETLAPAASAADSPTEAPAAPATEAPAAPKKSPAKRTAGRKSKTIELTLTVTGTARVAALESELEAARKVLADLD